MIHLIQIHCKKYFLLFLFLVIFAPVYSQDFEWWFSKHKMDVNTSWINYLITSSGFMGPNALPVPKVKKGSLEKNTTFEMGVAGHFSKGDKTQNLIAELFIPVAEKAGLELFMVPVEHYKMDTITRDLRYCMNRSGKGYTVGDVYISAYYQLLKEKNYYPDVLLSVNLKTASGNNIYNARYTDTPGYYFDLSFGKRIYKNETKQKHIKIYGMVGFYCYQTYDRNHRQNDAPHFGVGIELKYKNLFIDNNFGGYYGYLNNGDRPLVDRLSFIYKPDKKLNFKLLVQYGLHDFKYTSIQISCILKLNKLFFSQKK